MGVGRVVEASAGCRVRRAHVQQPPRVRGGACGQVGAHLLISRRVYAVSQHPWPPLLLPLTPPPTPLLPPAGTTRADGETVGFETEGTAIYDTMTFVKNEVGGDLPRGCLLLCSVRKASTPL